MKERIAQAKDPGLGCTDRICDLAVRAWNVANPTEPCVRHKGIIQAKLMGAGPAQLEAFFHRFARAVYDEDLVGREYNLNKMPEGANLRKWMSEKTEQRLPLSLQGIDTELWIEQVVIELLLALFGLLLCTDS